MRPRHTGSLQLRGRIWWARYAHRGKQVQVSTGHTDRAKAATFLKNALKDADTPRFVAPSADKLTFEDLCTRLRSDRAKKQCRSRIEQHLARLADAFAGMRALKISTEAVEQYVDARLRQQAKPATINRELAALRRAFRLAVYNGALPTMPRFQLLTEDNTREGFIDPPDFEAFLTALRARDPDAADASEFAYRTALRRGNVLHAQWQWCAVDVEQRHLVAGRIRIPGSETKNKKALTLPLTGQLLALIDRRWRARVETCPYIFHRRGVQLVRFDDAWRAAAADIGRPAFLFHDLRRSAARTLRRAGVDEQTIMKIGGWKTRSMFARYAIVDDQDVVAAQAALDAAFNAGGQRAVVPLRRPSKV